MWSQVLTSAVSAPYAIGPLSQHRSFHPTRITQTKGCMGAELMMKAVRPQAASPHTTLWQNVLDQVAYRYSFVRNGRL